MMEPENLNQEPIVEQRSLLHKVTPLSKYLAMLLFVTMPFIGGWIGYTYAPEKVVEVDRIVSNNVPVKEVEENTDFEEPTVTCLEQTIRNDVRAPSDRDGVEIIDGFSFPKQIRDKEVGSITTVNSSLSKTVNYGEKNVEILKFMIQTDSVEDVFLDSIAIDLFGKSWGGVADPTLRGIRNFRLVDENNHIYAKSDCLEPLSNEYPDHVLLKGQIILEKDTTKIFTVLADLPSYPSLESLTVLIPAFKRVVGRPLNSFWSHFEGSGEKSGERPYVFENESMSNTVFLKKETEVGSLTVSDNIYETTHPRQSLGRTLGEFNFSAGDEEDVRLSEVSFRLSNYVFNQFRNVKLMRDDVQFGETLVSPPVSDSGANIVFNGDSIIEAGETVVYRLVADVDIPDKSESEYGTQLQREIIVYLPVAQGLNSGSKLYINSRAAIWTWYK